MDVYLFGEKANKQTLEKFKESKTKIVACGFHEYWVTLLKDCYSNWIEESDEEEEENNELEIYR